MLALASKTDSQTGDAMRSRAGNAPLHEVFARLASRAKKLSAMAEGLKKSCIYKS